MASSKKLLSCATKDETLQVFRTAGAHPYSFCPAVKLNHDEVMWGLILAGYNFSTYLGNLASSHLCIINKLFYGKDRAKEILRCVWWSFTACHVVQLKRLQNNIRNVAGIGKMTTHLHSLCAALITQRSSNFKLSIST